MSKLTNEQRNFLDLLNSDSVLELSLIEKQCYFLFFAGKTDAEICEITGLRVNTIIQYRRQLRKSIEKSKATLYMAEQFKISNKEKVVDGLSKKDTNPFQLITLNEDLTIKGVCPVPLAHALEHIEFHASVIILVYKKSSDGKIECVISDKNYSLMSEEDIFSSNLSSRVDILGGHLKLEANKNPPIGKKLTDSDFYEAAAKELREELYIAGVKEIDVSRLQFITYDEYNGQILPGGFNHEISGLYIYCLPDCKNIDVRVYDEWVDSTGQNIKHRFPGKFVNLDEFLTIADSAHPKYRPMNALERFGKILKGNKSLIEKFSENA